MSFLYDINREPDHINELGVKWWLLSEYLRKEIPKHRVFYTESINKENKQEEIEKLFAITHNQKVLYITQSLEALLHWLDCIVILEKDRINNMKKENS